MYQQGQGDVLEWDSVGRCWVGSSSADDQTKADCVKIQRTSRGKEIYNTVVLDTAELQWTVFSFLLCRKYLKSSPIKTHLGKPGV